MKLHDLCFINVSTTSMLTSINAAALGLSGGLGGNASESKDPRVYIVAPSCKSSISSQHKKHRSQYLDVDNTDSSQ